MALLHKCLTAQHKARGTSSYLPADLPVHVGHVRASDNCKDDMIAVIYALCARTIAAGAVCALCVCALQA